ncbi:MAG: carboxylesterase/lipase family protein [Caulobacteraceae bacterium]
MKGAGILIAGVWALTLVGLAQAAAATTAGRGPMVRIAQGRLEGSRVNGVEVFRAIPFAAPPIGRLRWRAPEPPASWSGVRPATEFGPECMQPDLMGRTGKMSEDCLTLNVWTPTERRADARLPVMVWIYGGAFVWGSGSRYDGANLARRGMVVVTFNYRLGWFGFFAHPAILAGQKSGPIGDFGLLDQIAALKWVRANIAAFGGDPSRITIAGESAGGMSVNDLLVAPMARGVFQGAISESSFARSPGLALSGPVSAEDAALKLASSLGLKGEGAAAAAALRALPADKLNHPPTDLLSPERPQPIVGGRVLPENPADAFAQGREARVPLIEGGNSFEASLFPTLMTDPAAWRARLGPSGAPILALFADEPQPRAAADIFTDQEVIEPDRFMAAEMEKAGAPAWNYYFAYLPAAERSELPGVPHGGEIGFVFGTLPKKPINYGPIHIAPAVPADYAMSGKIQAYWAAFIKNGDPDSAGGPAWPRWTPSSQTVMVFSDEGPKAVDHFEQKRLDALQSLADRAGGGTPAH